MARRLFRTLPLRTLQGACALLVLAGLVFFGLTRTEVGREQLKEQIEAQFDARYAGRLRIGRLTGNLVGTVFARNVRLLGPEGQPIIVVDSVKAFPRWRALLGQELAFRKLVLHEPEVHLVRSERGRWNLAAAFRKTNPSPAPRRGPPLALHIADVVMQNGRVHTENRGALPRTVRKGWLFDYTDARVTDVDARFSIERLQSGLHVDLRGIHGQFAGLGMPIEQGRTRLTVTKEAVRLRALRLELGQTQMKGSFALRRSKGSAPPQLSLNLKESTLDHDELRRLVPRWPLRETTRAALDIHGPLDHLTIDRIHLERNTSALTATGTLAGLPEDLRFDVRFGESRLTASDLRSVVPGLPPQRLSQLARLGTTHFTLEVHGRLGDPSGVRQPLLARTRFNVRTEAGTLRGTADLSQRRGQPLAYSAEIQTDEFEAARLSNTSTLPSQLTGTFSVSGTGTSASSLTGSLQAQLEQLHIAGRRLDGLDADLRSTGSGQLSGTVTLRQHRGLLQLQGTADLSESVPAYDITARSRRFDLGSLLNRDSLTTALTGTAHLQGQGTSLGTLAGRLRLALDSSAVTRGGTERPLEPFRATLQLAGPDEAGPRLQLRSDLADLTVTSEADLPLVKKLVARWGQALAEASTEAYRKPYPAAQGTKAAGEARSEAPSSAPAVSPPARQAPSRSLQGDDEVKLQIDLDVKRPAVLQAAFPATARLQDALSLDATLQVSADSLVTQGSLQAASLHAGRLQASGLESQFEAYAALTAPLQETFDATFEATGGTLRLGKVRFRSPALSFRFQDERGNVQLSALAGEGEGHLQMEAGLHLLSDRNRLRIRTLQLAAGNYEWQNAAPSPIDLYSNAVVVPHLTLLSRNGPGRQPQRLNLRGTLSSTASDTLFAEADHVQLHTLSQLADLQRPLGGRLNARLAWTGGPRAPELTGQLDVSHLVFDDHLLGHLALQSRYLPGTPRVAFDAELRPEETISSAGVLDAPPPPKGTPLAREENRLSASGTVALPGLARADSEAGVLDLQLDIDRADLFFFEYLFTGKVTNVEGSITGTGHIGGSFQNPLFQADLQVNGGSFRVPRFGLQYSAEGDVRVDGEGIKIDGARVTDPDGGSASIQGALLFNDYDHLSFDLKAALDELQIIDVRQSPDLPFYGSIAASGPARLTGPLSSARLSSDRVRTTAGSELVLPIEEGDEGADESGFLIFADSTGRIPDLGEITQRENILDERPAGESSFVDGLSLDLGISAPPGSTVRLVFDPLLGDEIVAVGSGHIQLQRAEGDLSLFGTFDVEAGRYLFTAGEVFQRRFQIEEGTLRWDGPPANAALDLTAAYRTRASRAGLPGSREHETDRLPLIVRLGIAGRIQQPTVDLSLAVDRAERGFSDYSTAGLEAVLNRDDRESEYATSILLTNTFLLTTDLAGREQQGLSETGNRLAFNSVSQLVSSQLNRYLNEALPGLDVNLGVQGEDPQNLDVIYGVALRLLDERLVIRGEGVLNDDRANSEQHARQGFEGEFVVEVRLTPRVSAEAFYRREGSLLSDRTLTSTTGAGLSYQAEFSTWRHLWHRLFGWLGAGPDTETPPSGAGPVASGE